MSNHAHIAIPRPSRRVRVRRWRRLRWVLRLALFLLVSTVLMRVVRAFRPAPTAAVTIPLTCDLLVPSTEPVYRGLPETRYIFSADYGWFDQEHFGTGNPDDLIADVDGIVRRGGGTIEIHQGVQDGIIGYTGTYIVDGDVAHEDVTAVALAIYLDWSVRFEAWQARPPHGLAAPQSSFAVEDLPSQYVGFFAAARGMAVDDVFGCYLGPVVGFDEGPPALILTDSQDDDNEWPDVTWLRNRTFEPLVETEAGWEPVSWPEVMELRTVPAGADSWHFVSESTWIMGDGSEGPSAPPETADTRIP